jgi:integrase
MTGDAPNTATTVLHEIFESRLETLKHKGRSPKTVVNNRRSLVIFQSWLDAEGIDAERVTSKEAQRCFFDSPYDQGTRHVMSGHVSAAYSQAVKDDDFAITRNPLGKDGLFEKPSPADPDPAAKLIPNERLRIMRERAEAKGTKALALWTMLVYTGMRKDELRRLTWENINWADRTIKFQGKGSKWRTIPMHSEVFELLDLIDPRRKFTGPVLSPQTGGTVVVSGQFYGEGGAGFTKLLDSFADDGVSFHHFRKTLASSLYANGVQAPTIDEIFGWKPRSVQSRYYVTIKAESLHEAIEKAYADDPVS